MESRHALCQFPAVVADQDRLDIVFHAYSTFPINSTRCKCPKGSTHGDMAKTETVHGLRARVLALLYGQLVPKVYSAAHDTAPRLVMGSDSNNDSNDNSSNRIED